MPYRITEFNKEISRKNGRMHKYHSEKTKKKISEKMEGRIVIVTDELKNRLKKQGFQKGMEPWNKGKPGYTTNRKGQKHSEETKIMIAKKLIGRKHSPESIAKMTGVKFSEERRNNISGEKSHCWKGGVSFEPYSPKFNVRLKEKIRKRDQYRCQECFRHQSELNRKLSVHHIDFNKKNCDENNLISLCGSCHSQTNFGQRDWVNYYQKQMEIGGKNS